MKVDSLDLVGCGSFDCDALGRVGGSAGTGAVNSLCSSTNSFRCFATASTIDCVFFFERCLFTE
jgi:hypothetical protein